VKLEFQFSGQLVKLAHGSVRVGCVQQ